jgi:hypothetical protein
MTLEARVAALATQIGNYIRDSIKPRLMTWVKLAADGGSASNVNTPVDSGLGFQALANTTYIVELVGSFTSAATTTGIGAQLAVPTGAVVMGQAVHQATTTQTLTGHEQVASAATPQATSGVRAAATQTPIFGRWIVQIGATAGLVELWYKTEVNSSAVVLKKPSALGYVAI